jgi:hypothetical protein
LGNARYPPVTVVAFEPERTPVQKTLVKYEWREEKNIEILTAL